MVSEGTLLESPTLELTTLVCYVFVLLVSNPILEQDIAKPF